VVYIFAGHRRRADVREQLEYLAKKHEFELVMHEVDLVRGADQDVLDEHYWEELLSFIRGFKLFCIIATPHVRHTAEHDTSTKGTLVPGQFGPENTPMVSRG